MNRLVNAGSFRRSGTRNCGSAATALLMCALIALSLLPLWSVPAKADSEIFHDVWADVYGNYGGKVDPNYQRVSLGNKATIYLKPDPGFVISRITDNGRPRPIDNPYVIKEVNCDHTVLVDYQLTSRVVYAKVEGGHGFVEPEKLQVRYGDPCGIHINPELGYVVDSIYDNGIRQRNTNYYYIQHVTQDHNVVVKFADAEYTVTASVKGGHGRVEPSSRKYRTGQDASVFITPDPGYMITSITDTGDVMPIENPYMIRRIYRDHKVEVTFGINKHTVTAAVAGGHGGASPPTQTVVDGKTATVEIKPDTGYHTVSIVDNGVPQEISNPYVINDVTADHNVVVAFSNNSYQVTARADYWGSVSPKTQTVNDGGTASINITPDTGFRISAILDNGKKQTISNPYVITGVHETHDVRVVFTSIELNVTASVAGGHGIVAPPSQKVTYGHAATIGITPDAGYHIASITDNGAPATIANPYRLNNVTVDHNVVVSFAPNRYEVTASVSGGHGSADPPTQTVDHGGTASIDIDPDTGYAIDTITDNGAPVPVANPYVITGVQEAHDVEVTFNRVELTVNASVAGGHGTVAPPTQTVEYGHTAAVDITPEAGYHIASINDNGSPVTIDDPYYINNVTVDHTVVVTFALNQYTVDASVSGGHGTVDPPTQDILHGANATITINPEGGYFIATITDNGVLVPNANPYIITGVSSDHTVVVTFKASDYIVAASVTGGHGTVSPESQIVTLHGNSTPITISPESGHHIETVTDNGVSMSPVSPYQVMDVTTDHSVVVTFAANQHAVDATVEGGHGTVAPATQTVAEGATASINITPDTGYEIETISDNGELVAISNPYVITDVREDHQIVVTFDLREFAVNATVAGGHGTALPPTQTVDYGGTATIAMAPDPGYHIASITDNGSPVAISNPYRVNNVTAVHNVVVSFALDQHTVDAAVEGGHGTVAPETQTVAEGATASINITPDTGYEIATIYDNGETAAVSNPYVINNVQVDHEVVVTFRIRQFAVTASVAGGNGAVDPPAQTIDYGGIAAIEITPDPSYHIASITDNGNPVQVSNPYVIENVTAAHDVVVSFSIDTYPVDASVEGGNGTATPKTQTVAEGATAAVNIIPDLGYEIDTIFDNGVRVAISNPYVITDVREEHDVIVTFRLRQFAVTATVAGGHGTVDPPAQTVYFGDYAVIDMEPQEGYHCSSIVDNGVPAEISDPYYIPDVTGNHEVVVSYEIDQCTVDASVVGGNGTVTPATQTITWGGKAVVRIAPGQGYHISGISDNEEPVPISNPYTIGSVTGDHEVVVTFAIDEFTIKARVAGGNGAVQPVDQKITYGDGTAVILEPAPGYHPDLIYDNDVPKHASNPYVLKDVKSNHSIQVSYAANTYSDHYLAEGSTAWGFSTYICIENPNPESLEALLTYMLTSGETKTQTVGLPPLSQVTVNPADVLGQADFSTSVVCPQKKTIAVDRTMTWCGPGAPSGEAHSTVGVSAPAQNWYLPEGCSTFGFETWTLVENPNDQDALVALTYMIEDEGPGTFYKTVPAHSRATYGMEADIGRKSASTQVNASVPVVAERSMYRNNRREGSCSIGSEDSSTAFYLAEGSTNWGFSTYVLVQNPNDSEATVTLTCMTTSGARRLDPVRIAPKTRKTLAMNKLLPDEDFSTQIASNLPVIAERSMYWGSLTPMGEACHASIGLAQPHATFYLPDGQTSEGRETYTLVGNPNRTDVKVMVSYMLAGGAGTNYVIATVPAGSRTTFNMAEAVPSGKAAIEVKCLTEGKKVLAERSMYWNGRGVGTNTIGSTSD